MQGVGRRGLAGAKLSHLNETGTPGVLGDVGQTLWASSELERCRFELAMSDFGLLNEAAATLGYAGNAEFMAALSMSHRARLIGSPEERRLQAARIVEHFWWECDMGELPQDLMHSASCDIPRLGFAIDHPTNRT